MSTPAQPIQSQAVPDSQTASTAQPQPDAPDTGNVSLPEDAISGSTNLHRAFSKMNEALVTLADFSGVRRSATIPHQDSQSMASHLEDVGRALATTGGLTSNLILASHSLHASDGGSTVSFPAQKLRETIIIKDDPNAIKAINACKSFVSKMESLIGETPEVKLAKSQLSIVGKSDGSGMTLADLIIALINIPAPVIAAVARLHSGTKFGGHSPQLRAPRV